MSNCAIGALKKSIGFCVGISLCGVLSCCMPYLEPRSQVKATDTRPAPAVAASAGSVDPGTTYTVFAPVPPSPSNPVVATPENLTKYVEDRDACRREAALRLGRDDRDNVAAIRRALAAGPVDGKLTVQFEPGDAAMVRDSAVKNCLRIRGYIVKS